MNIVKKLLTVSLALSVLVAMLLPMLPVDAAGGGQDKKVEKEFLPPGQQRLNPYTVTKLVGQSWGIGRYEATISSLPQTLSDLETKITCEWIRYQSDDGVQGYRTGNNLLLARVTKNSVYVEYNGKAAVWDPKVFAGGAELPRLKGPVIVSDPINPNYTLNTVMWVYEASVGGILGFGTRKVTVTRYLRQIEGMLTEFYVLDKDPQCDISILQSLIKEKGFDAEMPVGAWDANGRDIPVEEVGNKKVVRSGQLRGRAYPVTIDPTTTNTYITSAYDGELRQAAGTYSAVREATWGYVRQSTVGYIGQWLSGSLYNTNRFMLFFPTADLPDNAVITWVQLKVYGMSDFSDTDFYLTVQNGQPSYPHMPPVQNDYNQANYSGAGSAYYTGYGFNTNGYNLIGFNTVGWGFINKTGWTKLILRSDRDIAGIAPTGWEQVVIREYSFGSGYEPILQVTYSLAIETPQVTTLSVTSEGETSAILHSYLADDGNEECSMWFKYGTSSPPGISTPPYSGYTTGSYFNYTKYGLSRGTLYYVRGLASNTQGTGEGVIKTFLTKPAKPSSVTVAPGNLENVLSWTKGDGADRTLVRFKTTEYPTSITDGTQWYFDTGSGTTHTSLTNGQIYYYSLWSEVTTGGLQQYSLSYTTGYGTPYTLGNPTVTTYAATNVETTTATLQGYLNDLGGYGTTDVWFQYHPDGGNWGDYTTSSEELSAPGSFSKNITSLDAATLYHARAVADNTSGTVYGSDVPFTTGQPSAPAITTNPATGTTLTQTTLHGKVDDDGGAVVTAWFEYGLTTEYGTATGTISGFYTDDTFYATITELEPNTTYHFRAIGENSVDKGYGSDRSFATSAPITPTATTGSATNVGATSATLEGTLTSDGGVECEVQFQYGNTTDYGTDTGWMTGYRSGDSIEQFISGLTVGETYHFRVQVKNATGTGSGDDTTFTTVFTEPQDFQAKPLSSSSIGLSWERIGDETAVYIKQGAYPEHRLDGTLVYRGSAESVSASNLQPGTTYFFRAWSWREGDVWSGDYAEDAATTKSSVADGKPETPGEDIVGDTPEEPPGWSQEPSGEAFSSWPLYGIIESVAADLGMPSGNLWLIVHLLGAMMLGLAILILTHSSLMALIGIAVGIGASSAMGVASLWMLFAYVVMAIAIIYFTRETV